MIQCIPLNLPCRAVLLSSNCMKWSFVILHNVLPELSVVCSLPKTDLWWRYDCEAEQLKDIKKERRGSKAGTCQVEDCFLLLSLPYLSQFTLTIPLSASFPHASASSGSSAPAGLRWILTSLPQQHKSGSHRYIKHVYGHTWWGTQVNFKQFRQGNTKKNCLKRWPSSNKVSPSRIRHGGSSSAPAA